MELILQCDAFDGAINLGDTGLAYVFACAQRCTPTAFAARWIAAEPGRRVER